MCAHGTPSTYEGSDTVTEARCVGTRCCERPEAIAACSTRGRGARERKKEKSTFPHLLKYVGKACTVLLYDKLK